MAPWSTGTSASPFAGDVAIAQGRVAAIGALADVESARSLDVDGRLVCRASSISTATGTIVVESDTHTGARPG